VLACSTQEDRNKLMSKFQNITGSINVANHVRARRPIKSKSSHKVAPATNFLARLNFSKWDEIFQPGITSGDLKKKAGEQDVPFFEGWLHYCEVTKVKPIETILHTIPWNRSWWTLTPVSMLAFSSPGSKAVLRTDIRTISIVKIDLDINNLSCTCSFVIETTKNAWIITCPNHGLKIQWLAGLFTVRSDLLPKMTEALKRQELNLHQLEFSISETEKQIDALLRGKVVSGLKN